MGPMQRKKVWVSIFLTATFFTSFSQPVPVTVDYDESLMQVRVRDKNTGEYLIEPAGKLGLWLPDNGYTVGGKSAHGTKIKPQIAIKKVSNGVDITWTFTNYLKDTVSIGEFYIGQLKLAQKVYYRNTQLTGQMDTIIAEKNRQFASAARVYPSAYCYSPVTVLADDKYVIAASFLFPALRYKHTLNQMFFGNFFEKHAKGWDLITMVNKGIYGQKYYREGELLPGESKQYTMCIRIGYNEPHCNRWLELLEPYKAYFKKMYGPVRYKKDPRPILGYHGSSDHFKDENNPYGFWNNRNVKRDLKTGGHPERPDLDGYRPTTQYLDEMLKQAKYQRMMVWTPTGQYTRNTHLNYPFKFTSHWLEGDKKKYPRYRGHKMNDAISAFRDFAKTPGRELGLWWGHSVLIMKEWDSPQYEVFDGKNKEHWRLSKKELQYAVQAGATLIGLDAFIDIPVWEQNKWLDTMIRFTRNKVKFCSEMYSCDIIHTKAAFFYGANAVKSPHYFADYLNEGHESWVQCNISEMQNADQVYQRYTKWGFNTITITYLGGKSVPNYQARDSWLYTSPKNCD